MNRTSWKPESNDSAQDTKDNRMGLAPVFAAALGAACCLAVPALVGLLAGSTSAAASGGGLDVLSLLIIGFALGGVLVVALPYLRAQKSRCDKSPQGKNRSAASSDAGGNS